ncbi:hypothetical protein I4U23_017966 [Adineta vaga]|nr:hypothetical protein I4U23_017966 [Adineta vaga]
MPRVSHSNDYLLRSLSSKSDHFLANDFDRYCRTPPSITPFIFDEQQPVLSPNEIDKILSRKLYNQLKITSGPDTTEQNWKLKPENLVNSSSTMNIIDQELITLIDRFFNLTYLNTIPMVNLLATAVATNFLRENIQELDNYLQEQQTSGVSIDMKRRASLLYKLDHDSDDDNVSWASAPM